MGCVGSCLCEDTSEEQERQDRRCLHLCRFCQLCFDLCHSLFQRRDQGVVPLHDHATLPLVATSQVDTGDNNTAVLLSNNDPRGSRQQSERDGLELGRAKGSIQVNIVDDSTSALPNNDPRDSQQTSVSVIYERVANTQLDREETNGSSGKRSNTCHSESLQPSPRMTTGVTCSYPSSDDEDECPICLEEYTTENPRSTLNCSHRFHLCCIYEWMERSHGCPFCSKVMLFKEDV